MWEVIVTDILVGVGIALLGVLTKVFSSWVNIQKKTKEENKERIATYDAWDALSKGVKITQDNYVDNIKKSAQDGRLTKTEIESANKKAVESAVSLASGPAVEIITNMAAETITNIIDSLLADNKRK